MRSQEEGRAEGSVDYDALWGNLMKQREEAISKGERGEDFDQLIVDSVILQAEEGNSADMLRLLDKKLPGQELPMSRNTEVREKVLRARDRITNTQASQATDLAQSREKLEKQQHEQKLSEAVLALSNSVWMCLVSASCIVSPVTLLVGWGWGGPQHPPRLSLPCRLKVRGSVSWSASAGL